MTNLLIHWTLESKNSIRVRIDFCCKSAMEAYKLSHPSGGFHLSALLEPKMSIGLKIDALIAIPHYAIGLPNGMIIAYCPFCGAKVISINTETGERLEWASFLQDEKEVG